jgi:hypothetical protein
MNSRLAASGAAILITAATLAAAGGYAVAESSSKGNAKLVACASTSTGTMRLVDPGTTCRPDEEKASWNQTGKPGADGASGPKGATGATGAPGAKGDKGEQGEKGDTGISGITVRIGEASDIGGMASSQRVLTPVCPTGSLALEGGVHGSSTGIELGVVRPADAAGDDTMSDPRRYALYLSNSNPVTSQAYLYVTCTTVPDLD